MAEMFTMRLDLRPWTAALTQLRTRTARAALARAANRTATSVRAVMARAIVEDLGAVRVGTVKDEIKIRKASPASDVPSAALTITGKRLPLAEFNARGPMPSRGRGRGVTVRMRGGAGRYPRAFLARMPSGHLGVFEVQHGSRRHGPRPPHAQLPIRELKGPSLPHVFAKVAPIGQARAEEQLKVNVASELRYALQRAAQSA